MSLKIFTAVLVFYFLTFTFARHWRRLVLLLSIFAVSSIAAQSLGLGDVLLGRPIAREQKWGINVKRRGKWVRVATRVAGIAGEPDNYAYTSAVALPLCVGGLLAARRRRMWLWAGGIAIVSAAGVASYSRGGLGAMAAGLLWFLYRAHAARARAVVVTAVLILALVASVPGPYVERVRRVARGELDESALHRIEYNALAVEVTAQHPWLGIGPDNFQVVNPRAQVVHNTYLQTSSELGLPALCALLILIALTIRDVARARHILLKADDRIGSLWLAALEAAVVATLAFWLFFSEIHRKAAWFLLSTAAASYQAVRPSTASAPSASS